MTQWQNWLEVTTSDQSIFQNLNSSSTRAAIFFVYKQRMTTTGDFNPSQRKLLELELGRTDKPVLLGSSSRLDISDRKLDEKKETAVEVFVDVLNDFSHEANRFSRIWFRLSVFLTIVTLILFGIIYPLSQNSSNSYFYTISSVSSLSSLSFSLDFCRLDIFNSPELSGTNSMTLSASVSNVNGIAWLPTVTGPAVSFAVVDARPNGEKYAGYSCSMQLLVDPKVLLPSTTITLLGTESDQVTATAVSWGNNSLTFAAEHVRSINFQVYLQAFSVGYLAVTLEKGHVRLLDVTFNGGVTNGGSVADIAINQPNARVSLRPQHSVNVNLGVSPNSIVSCVTGTTLTCNTTSEQCTVRYGLSETTSSSSLPTINVDGLGAFHLMSTVYYYSTPAPNSSSSSFYESVYPDAQLPPFYDDATFLSYTETAPPTSFSTFNRVTPAFLAADQTLVRNLAGSDIARYYILGPGVPPFVYSHSASLFYLVIPPSFFDIFSWSLLTPSVASLNVSINPAFCPGLQWAGLPNSAYSAENAFIIFELFKTTIGTAFQSMIANLYNQVDDWQTSDEKLIFVPSILPGEYSISNIYLANQPKILATIVLNIIVSVFASCYLMYLILYRLRKWAKSSLDDWGKEHYGEDLWAARKADILARTNVFFWAEFAVGTPSLNNASYWRMLSCVFVHFFVLILPVAPTCIGIGFFFKNDLQSSSGFLPVLLYIAMIIVFACLGLGILSLSVYYLDIYKHWSIKWLSTLHQFVAAVSSLVSVCYLVNVSFWVLLGVTLKPNQVLPIAAIVIVLFVTAYSSIQNIIKLRQQLEKELKTHYAAQATAAAVKANTDIKNAALSRATSASVPAGGGKATGSASAPADAPADDDVVKVDVQHLGLGDLLGIVKKSKVLELAGLSLWERIWTEVLTFFILVGTLSFLALGFWVFSTNTQFVSSITTIIVFIIGGGISIPVRVSSNEDRDNFVEKVRAHAAQTQDQQQDQSKKDS